MIKNMTGLILSFVVVILMSSCTQQTSSNKDVALTNELDSICYAIGIDIGKNLKTNGIDEINVDALAKGFSDSYGEGEGLMTAEDAGQYIRAYFTNKQGREAKINLKKAEDFLAENKNKEGVITTESGLQYKIITEGNGPIPTADNQVSVYYKGTRLDGTEFDSTKEGSPAKFAVTGVIRGWTEALQLMPVGSKWILYVPPSLGYGEQDRGKIKANDLLIFEIELLEIVK